MDRQKSLLYPIPKGIFGGKFGRCSHDAEIEA